jgi:hypothetical protein
MIMRAGPILNGQEFNRYQLAITNANDASATVRALAKTGVDLVKVHRRTSREAYFAVLAQAKQLSLPVAGHVPMTVSPEEASNAGQQTIEHVDTLFEGHSRRRSMVRLWQVRSERGVRPRPRPRSSRPSSATEPFWTQR